MLGMNQPLLGETIFLIWRLAAVRDGFVTSATNMPRNDWCLKVGHVSGPASLASVALGVIMKSPKRNKEGLEPES